MLGPQCNAAPTPSQGPVCDNGETFADMSEAVFKACCPGAANCSPIPQECSAECAGQYPNFYGSCQAVIEGMANAAELTSFLAVCQTP